jgi:hypothetical protein
MLVDIVHGLDGSQGPMGKLVQIRARRSPACD